MSAKVEKTDASAVENTYAILHQSVRKVIGALLALCICGAIASLIGGDLPPIAASFVGISILSTALYGNYKYNAYLYLPLIIVVMPGFVLSIPSFFGSIFFIGKSIYFGIEAAICNNATTRLDERWMYFGVGFLGLCASFIYFMMAFQLLCDFFYTKKMQKRVAEVDNSDLPLHQPSAPSAPSPPPLYSSKLALDF